VLAVVPDPESEVIGDVGVSADASDTDCSRGEHAREADICTNWANGVEHGPGGRGNVGSAYGDEDDE
jgi:hypothetical protein